MSTDKDRIASLEKRMFELETEVRRLKSDRLEPGECPTCLLPIGGNRVIRCTDDDCHAGLNTGGAA